MIIRGVQKLTLLDYPGKLAATVFLGGCNFRCPFCHNASVVLGGADADAIEEGAFFEFLSSRRTKLGGVCISGGEPTLHPLLPTFISNIKDMGFAVKLDTNGTNPHMLRSLVNDGLIDYVAMDIKNSPSSYSKTAGVKALDFQKIAESVDFLLSGAVDYEFRTTVVRPLHTEADFLEIGRWIKGAKAYFLQRFTDSGDLIEGWCDGYSEAEIDRFLNLILPYVPNAQIRG